MVVIPCLEHNVVTARVLPQIPTGRGLDIEDLECRTVSLRAVSDEMGKFTFRRQAL